MKKILPSISKLLAGGAFALTAMTTNLQAEETVKVGVLHSLSGTMAISETSLRDVLLFTFDEINASGGVLGKMIEPVVADGASDWRYSRVLRESRMRYYGSLDLLWRISG
jgi:urea transport system substrate-binding protein